MFVGSVIPSWRKNSNNFQAMLKQSEYAVEKSHALQRLMWRIHASSHTTQAILESTFGHLKDIAQRHAKSLRMSPHTCWFYSAASPFIRESGMAQNLPTSQDFVEYFGQARASGSPQMQSYNKALKPDTTSFPAATHVQFPKTAKGLIKKKWRCAGPLSHYRSSASMAYLVKHAECGFSDASKAWGGVILQRGGIFVNEAEEDEEKKYWLSLGFVYPAAICISLQVKHFRGQDRGRVCLETSRS